MVTGGSELARPRIVGGLDGALRSTTTATRARPPRQARRASSAAAAPALVAQRRVGPALPAPRGSTTTGRAARRARGPAIGPTVPAFGQPVGSATGRARYARPVAIVRLFAGAREAAGTGATSCPATTVDDVLGRGRQRYGRRSPRSWRRAASGSTANRPPSTRRSAAADEVAVLPPVSGGSAMSESRRRSAPT